MMIYRSLGSTGEKVSAIGLGGWHLGLKNVDEQLAIRIVRTAIDRGINFQAFEAVRTFRPMSDQDLQPLLARTSASAAEGIFEPFKTTSIFDGTAQNPAWLGEEPENLRQLMPE